ncbi:MAG TPA: helix-turn-helix domain-containing protein [Mycobacteriales bacterium]|nr:helix-turn-helix domain-containing protein [Mycobacteriales bacterium]
MLKDAGAPVTTVGHRGHRGQPPPEAHEGYAAGRATKELLITTAQRLFAERGIDAVSLREVATTAGTRNTAAAQYYFGDKEALVLAIFRRHTADITARRLVLLERAVHAADPLRATVEAIVSPLADQLDGNGFLIFLARCQSDHVRYDGVLGADVNGSFLRARQELRHLLPDLPDGLFRRRFDLVTKLVVTALAGVQWRAVKSGHGSHDVEAIVVDLVDIACGMLLAPSSRPPSPRRKAPHDRA